MERTHRHPSSYRDPSGFLFFHEGQLFRQVNQCYRRHYEHFSKSGLYQTLVEQGRLIPHREVDSNLTSEAEHFLTIEPERLSFISYPYEWCFDMWKAAALLTLSVMETALEYGMVLKDASAYNVQWHKGQMVFIDTLSFEVWDKTRPWVAYRQFCEHFLAPLALMHFLQQPLQSLFLAYPDGIPLQVATSMLPWKSKWHLHSYLHLHLQQRVVKKERASEHSVSFTPQKMKNLVRSLRTAIESYRLEKKTGVWSGYYQEASQRGNYLEQKTAIIESWASTRTFRTVLDTGANEGHFSNFFARKGAQVVAVDFDHFSVNQLFKKASEHAMPILPLVADLSEPSPAMGMNYDVRPAFVTRFKSDLVIALALIHHLAIGKYFSFDTIASFYATLGSFLIIEFVGPADEKVKNMLSQKHISFDWYTEDAFRIAFAKHFSMMEFKTIPGTNRTLYLLRNDATGTNT